MTVGAFTRCVGVLGALALPASGYAQEVFARDHGRIAKEHSTTCNNFYYLKATKTDPRVWGDVAICAEDVLKRVQEARDEASSTALNEELIGLRANYKRLKGWVPRRPPEGLEPPVVLELAPPAPKTEATKAGLNSDSTWVRARKAVDELNVALDQTMKRHSLFEQFSATLITGAVFLQDAGPVEGQEDKQDEAPTAVGTLAWQSRHFGDEEYQTRDISFGGRIGFQPVLTLTEPAAPAEGEEPSTELIATHQPALVWTLGTQLNLQHRGVNAETTFFGKTGAGHLLKLPKAVDRGEDSILVLPVENGVGKTAWFWEAGLEFSMFDNRLEQLHAEKGMTSPQFQLQIAWRHDARFRATGALDGFDRPEHRLVFRLMLDAIKVLDRRRLGEPAKPFTFGFAVEHERSIFGGSETRVPSATRIMLRGDLNLLRALTGESTEAVDPAAGGG